MEEIRVKDIKIKAKVAKDKSGRKGYFIAESDLRKNRNVRVVHLSSTKIIDTNKIRPDVKGIVEELRSYKDGKIKLRSLDEFLKTL